MVRFKDAYLVTWNLGKEPIRIEEFPASAFDSSAERTRVAALIDRYNSDLQMSPILDREFATLARERKSRRPIRTYIEIPLASMATVLVIPHIVVTPAP